MTMHNDGEDTWFIDENGVVPIWRTLLSWFIAAALIGIIMGIAMGNAFAVPNRNPPPAEDDPNEVRIALMCGTLKGSGSIVIVDPVQQKVYKFDFVCPTVAST